jgi:sulfotransferase family protein
VKTYEVLSVSQTDLPTELEGSRVAAPRTGGIGDAHVLPISGRITGHGLDPAAVEISYNERVIRRSPVSDGFFNTLVGLVGLKIESELSLQAAMGDDRRLPLATIRLRREPIRTSFQPTIQPLILTSLGRTGTTLLMKAFTSRREILVFRRFPYEYAVAKYWVHMLRVLSGPADLLESGHPDSFIGNQHWVGRNPYHDESVYSQRPLGDWFGREYVERLASFCQESIEGCYRALAQGQDQAEPVYFAEKVWPSFVPVLTWELYPKAKEVILVRDFRDAACSMLAFDSIRDYSDFGRADGKSTEDYINDEVRAMALDMTRSWTTRRDRAHLVRYEDLVLHPVDTMTRLLEYLELDNSAEVVNGMLDQASEEVAELPGAVTDPYLVEIHRTIPDPRETIGRWRRESDDSRADLFWNVLGDCLEEFGYTRSGDLE